MAFVLKLAALITVVASGIGSGLGLTGHMPQLAHGGAQPTHAVVHFVYAPGMGVEEALNSLAPAPDPAPAPDDQAPGPAPEPVLAAPAPAPVLRAAVAPAPAAPPAPAPPPITIGSAQQALINQDRAAAGLPPLNWSGCLASIAAGQAQAMASAGSIFHGNGVQQDWGCRLGSSQTGENVGVWGSGINDGGINQLFMNSAPHRANIMGPYHYVGTAWVIGKNGAGYIAVEFA